MSAFAVVFHDGRRAAAHAARLSIDAGGQALVELPGETRRYPASALRIGDRVGAGSPRRIDFPDGALAYVEPDEEADRQLDALAGGGAGWVRRLEARWPQALAALALAGIAVFGFLRWGLPALAAAAAERVPAAFEREVGERALAGIDEDWLKTSRLPPGRQQDLRAQFEARIVPRATGAPLSLEFRGGGPLGPNALALPGGIVVVTDELVERARHDDEILMVLAHEAGHAAHRHTMRQLFESLGLAAVLSVLIGDLSGPASLAAALPAVLTQMAFSRRDEREADAWAFDWADAAGVPRTRMTDLLSRIEAEEGEHGWPAFLSTHPSSRERTDAARAPR